MAARSKGEGHKGHHAAEKGLLSSTFHGARMLFLVRTGQRLLTFTLNQALVRMVSPSVFGFASIELELLLATVLFLSREGLRLSLLRSTVGVGASADTQQRAVNLAWLCVPIGCTVAMATGLFFAWTQDADGGTDASMEALAAATLRAHRPYAIAMYCFAAVLETVAEPAYILSQNHLLYGLRGGLEMAAMTGRCVATCVLVWAGLGALAFGAAQVVFAAILVVGYFAAFWRRAGSPGFPLRSFRDLFPRAVTASDERRWYSRWVDGTQLSMAVTFTQQSLFKHLLTQGDRIVLAWSNDLMNQGVYAVVTNYGSLVVRLLFQPLEEVSRVLLAKLMPAATAKPDGTSGDKAAAITPLARRQAARGAKAYTVIARSIVMVGLVIACFGSNYTHVLIRVLLGSRWSATEAPSVLAYYCFYVLFLAMNGITEACVTAIATKVQLRRLNAMMLVIFACYAAVCIGLLRTMGTAGVVVAGTAHMAARIAVGWHFLATFFSARSVPVSVAHVLPTSATLVAFAVGAVTTLASKHVLFPGTAWPAMASHVAVGACAFALVATAVWKFDRGVLRDVQALRAGKLFD